MVRKLNQNRPVALTKSTGMQPGFSTQQIQDYNQKTTFSQGFRFQFTAAGTITNTPVLNGGGIFLYGLSVTTGNPADLGDTTLTFAVNNTSYLVDVPCSQVIPNYVQGFLFFPVPTPLSGGKDVFKAIFTKNNAGVVTFYLNLFYLPNPTQV